MYKLYFIRPNQRFLFPTHEMLCECERKSLAAQASMRSLFQPMRSCHGTCVYFLSCLFFALSLSLFNSVSLEISNLVHPSILVCP